MAIFTWKEEFSINVAEIDAQHKKMIEHVNILHDAVQACEAQEDEKEVIAALVALIDFTRIHFSTEEEYMHTHGFPDQSFHHREHQALVNQLEAIVEVVSKGIKPNFCKDYDLSNDWVICHILGADKELGRFLNDKDIF